ncbi:MAG: DCC1-like thiol-disulfide oxidoreductase family protein [Akkermansiaceae bacterium]
MNAQFSLFRILLGSFLTIHFAALVPYGTELFSREGLLSDGSLNFTPALPFLGTPVSVLCFLLASVLASIFLTVGFLRRTSALFLWLALTVLFLKNNLISNPSLPYLGLILCLIACIPPGERWSLAPKNPNWKMPPLIIPGATFLLALSYTFSGWTKLSSPSWIDGSAMLHILNNPLARPGTMRDLVLSLPTELLALATWAALLAELLYLPLTIFRKTRPWVWLALLLMHLGLIVLIDFADLSLGMMMIHLFTFDPKWLSARETRVELSFDADCLMCSRFIHFLAHEDKAGIIRFAPLPVDHPKDSMVVSTDDRHYFRSSALLVLLSSLGGHWHGLAILGWLIPRPFRDLAYRIIAGNRHLFFKNFSCPIPSDDVTSRLQPAPQNLPPAPRPTILKQTLTCLLLFTAAGILLSCSPAPVHHGRFPFSLMDRAPGGNHLHQPGAAFVEISPYQPGETLPTDIRTGDVIAFHISHREAWSHLIKGKIQKIPYELFSYGHLALVVEKDREKRLLQLAMKQAANIDDDLTYLDDKNWILYRPTREIDETRLDEFVSLVLKKASSPKKAYDYTGALGLWNRPTNPESVSEIAPEYTCVTLIQSAFHYTGHPMKVSTRKGYLDIITPAQLIESKIIPLPTGHRPYK